jgi:hypothetical protein
MILKIDDSNRRVKGHMYARIHFSYYTKIQTIHFSSCTKILPSRQNSELKKKISAKKSQKSQIIPKKNQKVKSLQNKFKWKSHEYMLKNSRKNRKKNEKKNSAKNFRLDPEKAQEIYAVKAFSMEAINQGKASPQILQEIATHRKVQHRNVCKNN